MLLVFILIAFSLNSYAQTQSGYLLPDGTKYETWEVPVKFSKTYYVDNGNPNASDTNPGTKESPFLTINKAAKVLEPGERVVIMSGIYRECVIPLRGGTGPNKIISYEAAPGAVVIIKGSVLASPDKWQPSTGFRLGRGPEEGEKPAIFQYNLEGINFNGYNPFGMVNIMMDKGSFPWHLAGRPDQVKPYILRRGMIFVDGHKMEQVEMYTDLELTKNAFWVEDNGLTVHLRLSGDENTAKHKVEFVVHERVFAPQQRYLGYIRLKGITFEHGASGFPVPQRGLVSTNRGNHWIIEDCNILHANSVGLDIGRESWDSDSPTPVGYTIVRRTHVEDAGICGIAGVSAVNSLIESCLIEKIGWQNVEQSWESAGIKIHFANNDVIANCVIRDISYASGIWFDAVCNNSRISNNVIGNIKETKRGAIYIEASHYTNMVDQNILWNISSADKKDIEDGGGNGILIDGSDEEILAHNLIGMCDNAAVKTRTAEGRIVDGGGGVTRWNHVENNLFYRSARGIDFSHKDNFADGNLYGRTIYGEYNRDAFRNRIFVPENIQPDLKAWQRYFGFDKNGGYANVNIEINLDDLTMKWSAKDDVPDVETGDHFKKDFFNNTAEKNRKAGPFASFPTSKKTISIDPRLKVEN